MTDEEKMVILCAGTAGYAAIPKTIAAEAQRLLIFIRDHVDDEGALLPLPGTVQLGESIRSPKD